MIHDDATKKQAIDLAKQGQTVQEIALYMRISERTISRWISHVNPYAQLRRANSANKPAPNPTPQTPQTPAEYQAELQAKLQEYLEQITEENERKVTEYNNLISSIKLPGSPQTQPPLVFPTITPPPLPPTPAPNFSQFSWTYKPTPSSAPVNPTPPPPKTAKDVRAETLAALASAAFDDMVQLAHASGADIETARRIVIEELNRREMAGTKVAPPKPPRHPKTIKTRPDATHFIIPDAQVKFGQNFDHFEDIGHMIVLHRPDVIVNLADWADMQSLSSYDKGTKKAEGQTYALDIAAAKDAMRRLLAPLRAYQATPEGKDYKPLMILTYGNHEERILRVANQNPELFGHLKLEDLEYENFGWWCYDFLDVVNIDGINYSHYFTSGVMGRPVGSAKALVAKKHASCVMGHVQGAQVHTEYDPNGKLITGIFASICYKAPQDYLGPQGNHAWAGIWLLQYINDGDFEYRQISLREIERTAELIKLQQATPAGKPLTGNAPQNPRL